MEEVLRALNSLGEFTQSFSRDDIKEVISTVFWFLVVFAVLQVLWRLNTIKQIVTEFNKARGPIWDLRGTINEFKELEPVIRQLAEQMSLLDEKVDAARKQVQELQVESFSGRTEEQERPADLAGFTQQGLVAPQPDHWERLHELWRKNADRIERVIEQIPDGRSRLPFDRMRRSDYTAIIDRLETTGRLTASAANGSRELVAAFNRFRPRNKSVPISVIGALEVLDQQLEREIDQIIANQADATRASDSPPSNQKQSEPSSTLIN